MNDESNAKLLDQSLRIPSGIDGLDEILNGGLTTHRLYLVEGNPGAGKTTTAILRARSALQRGEKVACYLFDEGLNTFLMRSGALGMDVQAFIDSGQLDLKQIDPAALSPGEFTCMVREAVEGGATMVVVDSLNAYLQAMPGEKFLLLQMHEMLSYLGTTPMLHENGLAHVT